MLADSQAFCAALRGFNRLCKLLLLLNLLRAQVDLEELASCEVTCVEDCIEDTHEACKDQDKAIMEASDISERIPSAISLPLHDVVLLSQINVHVVVKWNSDGILVLSE